MASRRGRQTTRRLLPVATTSVLHPVATTTVIHPVRTTSGVASIVTNQRLDESTKDGYRGKIRRIGLYLQVKHPNDVDNDLNLRLPLSLGK